MLDNNGAIALATDYNPGSSVTKQLTTCYGDCSLEIKAIT